MNPDAGKDIPVTEKTTIVRPLDPAVIEESLRATTAPLMPENIAAKPDVVLEEQQSQPATAEPVATTDTETATPTDAAPSQQEELRELLRSSFPDQGDKEVIEMLKALKQENEAKARAKEELQKAEESKALTDFVSRMGNIFRTRHSDPEITKHQDTMQAVIDRSNEQGKLVMSPSEYQLQVAILSRDYEL